jgi:hypothetical protein
VGVRRLRIDVVKLASKIGERANNFDTVVLPRPDNKLL